MIAIVVHMQPPAALPDGRVRLSCMIEGFDVEPREAWIIVPAGAAPASDDWAAPLMVAPGMLKGKSVHIEGRVSAKVMAAIPRVQAFYAAGNAELRPQAVTAREVAPTPRIASPRTGAFFSGGLDSWHTALTNEAQIDELIFAVGIDMRSGDHARRAMIEPRIAEAAAALGKPLQRFETNLRELYLSHGRWSLNFLGPVLGACALALSGRYDRVLIGAAHNERFQHMLWSTSGSLDPLWSSEAVDIVHDGAVSRMTKTRTVAASDIALRSLRVCWRKDQLLYNCGQCEKCVRTMAALHLVGALERCTTFDRPLDLNLIASQYFEDWSGRTFVLEALEEAIADERHRDLMKALAQSLLNDKPVAPAAPAPPPPVAVPKPKRSLPQRLRREAARVARKIAARWRSR